MTTCLKSLLGAGLLSLPLGAQTAPGSHVTPDPGTTPLAATGPLGSIHAHLRGFHFYSGDMKRAVRVEHYCSHAATGVMQCVVYDSDRPDARLIGIEYIISEARFNQLSAAEKQLWHSHRYEVMSGLLTATGLSPEEEMNLMKMFVSTYGKTWTLWQVDRGDEIPLGLPQLMMGFTADGQLDPAMVAGRNREMKIDSVVVREQRAALPVRPVAAGADAWQHQPAFQIRDDTRPASPAAPARP